MNIKTNDSIFCSECKKQIQSFQLEAIIDKKRDIELIKEFFSNDLVNIPIICPHCLKRIEINIKITKSYFEVNIAIVEKKKSLKERYFENKEKYSTT